MNVKASPGPPKGAVSLSWTQSPTSGVTQNNMYRRASPGSYPSTPTAAIKAAISYVDNSKLTSGAQYCYVVTAVSSGGESPPSNEACANAK